MRRNDSWENCNKRFKSQELIHECDDDKTEN